MFGHIRYVEHFTRKYLTYFFEYADYIELNDNVLQFTLERLNVKNEIELFELLNLEFLVITKGKKGATFLFKENGEIKCIDKAPEKIVDSVDTSGAGDAFFSAVLREYAYTDKIDEAFVNRVFLLANKASRDILMNVGSRK